MHKAARHLDGVDSLNPRRWRGERFHHHGGGVCWLFVLLWMDSWHHELIVCKKWYKNNLKMRLTALLFDPPRCAPHQESLQLQPSGDENVFRWQNQFRFILVVDYHKIVYPISILPCVLGGSVPERPVISTPIFFVVPLIPVLVCCCSFVILAQALLPSPLWCFLVPPPQTYLGGAEDICGHLYLSLWELVSLYRTPSLPFDLQVNCQILV